MKYSDLDFNTVLAINEDVDGNIWISAFSDGIYICDSNMNTVRHLDKKTSGISSDEIFVIFKDSSGQMWLSGENGTISCVTTDTDAQIRQYDIKNVPRSIIESTDGVLFIGGSDGLGKFNCQTGTYRKIWPRDTEDFYSAIVYSVAEINEDVLAIGTEGKGLILLTHDGEELGSITTDNGLISNTIYGIERDSYDNLWCSSSRGLSAYRLSSGKITNFSNKSGLKVNGYIYCSHDMLHDGRLVFGGIGGATLISPDKTNHKEENKSIYFENLLVSNKKVIAGPKSPINAQINNCNEISLRYNQNNFSISFRSIQPAGTFPDLYDWQLAGYSKDWTYSTSARTIDFVNLPPGKYVLKIRSALTPDTVYRELPIIIRRPWFASLWIIPIYCCMVISIIILGLTYIRNALRTKMSENKVKVFATLVHDIKNPLSVIKLALGKIQDMTVTADNDELRHDVNLVIDHSDKITNIINQLLDIETKEEVDFSMRAAKYRIEASLMGFMSAYEDQIAEKSLRVSYDFPETPTWIWFDMDMMLRVFQNLIDNAIKYTPAGGSIKISTERLEKECVISITDTGLGIPANEKSKIFKQYFRASNVIKATDGSGVGLMVAKELVRKMHGNIRFVSTENEGTTFYIYLPLGSKHINESDMIRPGTPPSASITDKDIRIVFVEDNQELQNIITEHLNGLYSIFVADNGTEALKKIREVSPQLVITDYMMSGMTGVELLRTMKADNELRCIPVIMLTALTSSTSKVTAYKAGAEAIIEKPFDMDVLLSRIENILNHGTYPQITHFQDTPMEEDRILSAFISNVRDQLSDSEFNMDNICRQLGVSYPTLYRKVKSVTGNSPIDIVIRLRLEQADEYLKTRKYSVSQVCYMTGFSSPSYFTKIYKKRYCITPTQRVQGMNTNKNEET